MKLRSKHCLVLAIAGLVSSLSGAVQAQHQATATPAAASSTAAPKINLVTTAGFAPDGKLWRLNLNSEGKLRLRQSADAGRNWSEERLLELANDKPNPSAEAPVMLAFGAQQQVLMG